MVFSQLVGNTNHLITINRVLDDWLGRRNHNYFMVARSLEGFGAKPLVETSIAPLRQQFRKQIHVLIESVYRISFIPMSWHTWCCPFGQMPLFHHRPEPTLNVVMFQRWFAPMCCKLCHTPPAADQRCSSEAGWWSAWKRTGWAGRLVCGGVNDSASCQSLKQVKKRKNVIYIYNDIYYIILRFWVWNIDK